MDIQLKNKTAFVCGSTQGIGKATAVELADLGANVVLIARNEEKLKSVTAELTASEGQKHHYIQADFDNPNELKAAVNAFIKNHPEAHILINNSGGPKGGPIVDADPEEFNTGFTRHVICNQLLVQALLPAMKKANYGRVINIISTSVKQPIPGLGVSNTVRGAVASWAKTLASELGPFGITVNNVLPGFTKTERLASLFQTKAEKQGISLNDVEENALKTIPAGRFAEPKEVAEVIAFLASPSAAYINGINVPIDGGRLSCL